MFAKPVASLVVLVAASLASSLAYAADVTSASADAPQHHHVREVGGAAKKKTTAAAPHGRGRHAAAHDGKKKDAPKHARVGHAAPLPPAVVIGAPAPAPVPPPPVRHAPHADAPSHACQKHPVTIIAGDDDASFPLMGCDGRPAAGASERLSVLARPSGVAEPSASVSAMQRKKGPMIAPGVRRMSTGLVERLQKVSDHFARAGKTTRITLVSGYRPQAGASYHATGRALDFKVDGVENDALIAFCKTLEDTGCGYYPNSDFIHMDVRDAGTGHVAWIDANSAADSRHEHGAVAHHAAPSNAEADMDPPAVLGVPETPQTWQP